MAEKQLHQQFMALPDCPKALCKQVLDAFGDNNFTDYAYALLLDIHGWASWMAYNAWQDNFAGKSNEMVEQLLAIRLAWEWVLWQLSNDKYTQSQAHLRSRFLNQFSQLLGYEKQQAAKQDLLWVWQTALEQSLQSDLHLKLLQAPTQSVEKPKQLQAIFCIDVRSEPMRRALEEQHGGIQTFGFAGFFGLPIELVIKNTGFKRPQLPGLLTPSIQAEQKQPASKSGAQKLNLSQRLFTSFDSPPSSFGLVEMLGLYKAGSLLKKSFWPPKPAHSINQLCDNTKFTLSQNNQPLSLSQQADLVASILNNMGLTQDFAPTVILFGHGSCSANNPQAASLDCGACGGQTGETNVKILAQLLNDPALRNKLAEKDIIIPKQTQFIAGLHNTTTYELICYGIQSASPWQQWLAAATASAQKQRAPSLGLSKTKTLTKLNKQYTKRSRNWAEIRPEWGLANNAAFIVAPRHLTQSINLEGRSFLHEYNWQTDKSFSILELIMTAPMVVTNWINLQYYASTVDNRFYGSGNKLLHNVVGEHIGLFEGNGGDLRIGLSKQSLHDGTQWRHQPLRLSVYIDAPQKAIADIANRHLAITQLINNDWLYLFQIDKNNSCVSRYYNSQWQQVTHR